MKTKHILCFKVFQAGMRMRRGQRRREEAEYSRKKLEPRFDVSQEIQIRYPRENCTRGRRLKRALLFLLSLKQK